MDVVGTHSVSDSYQPPSALGGPTAAEELLALQAAHLVVVVPGELCYGVRIMPKPHTH